MTSLATPLVPSIPPRHRSAPKRSSLSSTSSRGSNHSGSGSHYKVSSSTKKGTTTSTFSVSSNGSTGSGGSGVSPRKSRPKRALTSTGALSKMAKVINVWRDLHLRNKNNDRKKKRRSRSLTSSKQKVVFKSSIDPIQSDDPDAIIHDVFVDVCEFDPREASLTITDTNWVTIQHEDTPWYEQEYEELPWWEYPDLEEDDELTAHVKDVILESHRNSKRMKSGRGSPVSVGSDDDTKWIQGHADRVEALVMSFVLKLRNRAAFTELRKQQEEKNKLAAGGEVLDDVSLGSGEVSMESLQSLMNSKRRNSLQNSGSRHGLNSIDERKSTATTSSDEQKQQQQQQQKKKAPVESAPSPAPQQQQQQQQQGPIRQDEQEIMRKLLNPSPPKNSKPKITKADVQQMVVPRRGGGSTKRTPRRTKSGTSQQSHSVLDDDSVSLHSAVMSTGWNKLNIHNSEMNRYRKNHRAFHRSGSSKHHHGVVVGNNARGLWADDHTVTINHASGSRGGIGGGGGGGGSVGGGDDDVKSVASFQSSPALMEYHKTRQSWMQFNPNRHRRREPKKVFRLTTSATSTWGDDNSSAVSEEISPTELNFHQSDSNLSFNSSNNRKKKKKKKKGSIGKLDFFMKKEELKGGSNLFDIIQEEPEEEQAPPPIGKKNRSLSPPIGKKNRSLSPPGGRNNKKASEPPINNKKKNKLNLFSAPALAPPRKKQEEAESSNDSSGGGLHLSGDEEESQNSSERVNSDDDDDSSAAPAKGEETDDDDKSKSSSSSGSSSGGSSGGGEGSSSGGSGGLPNLPKNRSKGKGVGTGKASKLSNGNTLNLKKKSAPPSKAAAKKKISTADAMAQWELAVLNLEKEEKAVEELKKENQLPSEKNILQGAGTKEVAKSPSTTTKTTPQPATENRSSDKKPPDTEEPSKPSSFYPKPSFAAPAKRQAVRRASGSGVGLFSMRAFPQTAPRGGSTKDESTTTPDSSIKKKPQKRNGPLLTRRASFSDLEVKVQNDLNEEPKQTSMKDEDPKMRLVMLRHAAMCTQTQKGAVCPSDPKCSQMKELLRHMMGCKHQSQTVPCNFPGCHESKNFLIMMHKTSQILARQKMIEKDLPPVVCFPAAPSLGKKNDHSSAENDDDDLSDIGSFGSAGGGMDDGDMHDDDDDESAKESKKKEETLDRSSRSQLSNKNSVKNMVGALDKSAQSQASGGSRVRNMIGALDRSSQSQSTRASISAKPTSLGPTVMSRRTTWSAGNANAKSGGKPLIKDKALVERMKKEQEEKEKMQADLRKRHEAVKARVQSKIQGGQTQKQEPDTKRFLRDAEKRTNDQAAIMEKRRSELLRDKSDGSLDVGESDTGASAVGKKEGPEGGQRSDVGIKPSNGKLNDKSLDVRRSSTLASQEDENRLKEQEEMRRKHAELKAKVEKSKAEKPDKVETEAANTTKKIEKSKAEKPEVKKPEAQKPAKVETEAANTTKKIAISKVEKPGKPPEKAEADTTQKIKPVRGKSLPERPAASGGPREVRWSNTVASQEEEKRKQTELKAKGEKTEKEAEKKPKPFRRKSLPANPGRAQLPANTGRIQLPANSGRKQLPANTGRMQLPSNSDRSRPTRLSQSATSPPTKPLSDDRATTESGRKKLPSEIVYENQIEAASAVAKLKAAKLAKKAKKAKRASII